MQRRNFSPLAAFATAIIVAACGGGGSGDDAGPASGEWSGTTAQGKTISFTLDNGVLTQARISYDTSSAFCSSRSKTTLTGLREAIVNDALAGSITTGGPNSDTIAYSARFAGSNSVSGTLDISGACGSASTTFTASPGAAVNSVPVADAGADQAVNVGTQVSLKGSQSKDAENDSLTSAWTLLETPPGSAAKLTGAAGSSPTFTPDLPGTYVVGLVVNDGSANSAADTVTVTATALLLDGAWEGTDSGGNALSFTVVDGKITQVSIGYSIVGDFCTAKGTTTTTFSPPLEIKAGSFSASGSTGGPTSTAYSLKGSFTGEIAASGTLTVSISNSFPNPPCSGSSSTTWTAAKMG